MAKIIPVHKKSRTYGLVDFRPISLFPALSKALEIIMKQQIDEYLDYAGLLSAFQSGFRHNHSTTTFLLKITEDIRRSFEDEEVSLFCCFLIFQGSLIVYRIISFFRNLLVFIGFSNSAVSLVSSYLGGRSMQASLLGATSDSFVTECGVFQYSVLSPLLFNIYINDLRHSLRYSKFQVFADDFQFYCSTKPGFLSDCLSNVNLELTAVSIWAKENGLVLNTSKTQTIIFSRCGCFIHDLRPIILNGIRIPISSNVRA